MLIERWWNWHLVDSEYLNCVEMILLNWLMDQVVNVRDKKAILERVHLHERALSTKKDIKSITLKTDMSLRDLRLLYIWNGCMDSLSFMFLQLSLTYLQSESTN